MSARSAVGNAGEWLLTAEARFRLLSGDPGFRFELVSLQECRSCRGALRASAWALAARITNMVVFAQYVLHALTPVAVFVLRRKMRDAVRPYRTPGYHPSRLRLAPAFQLFL